MNNPTEFPLSFAQQALWEEQRWYPGRRSYHLATCLLLSGTLDIGLLARCVNEIVARHDALRATFGRSGGEVWQRVAPPLSRELPVVSLAELPEDARWTTARHVALRCATAPFDHLRGPMFRARLLRFSASEHVLVAVIHHLVTDWWSSQIFFRELTALYEALAAGQPSPLRPLPMQYRDVVRAQRERLTEARVASLLGFWTAQLEGVGGDHEPPVAPAAAAGPDAPGHSFLLSHQLSSSLAAFCREQRVTRFAVLLLALYVLLRAVTSRGDVVILSSVANRNSTATEGLIGLFSDVQLFRIRLQGQPTLREALHAVWRLMLDVQAHQELPSVLLFEALRHRLGTRRRVPCHAFLNVRLLPACRAEIGDLLIEKADLVPGARVSHFGVNVDITLQHDRLRVGLFCDDAFYDGARVAQLGDQFAAILERIVASPQEDLAALISGAAIGKAGAAAS